MSAFWILSVNSWMNTPQGYTISPDGRFLPADWFAIIFNPSFPYRLIHMVLASYLSVAFAVGAVGAFHLLRNQANPMARTMFSMALWMAVIVAPIQIVVGDQHGLNTLQYQPAKIAAMEGDWISEKGQPLILFGMPDMQAETTRWAVEIPHLGALILTHEWDGSIKGLKEFPPDQRPYAPVVFWSFRVMVALGVLMVLAGIAGLWLRWKGRLYQTRWLQRAMVAMAPSGFIALLAGWTTTEVGRQPYTVYGLLRTADSVSPIGLPGVAASLAGFAIVYFIVFGAGLVFILRLMAQPPTPGEPGPAPDLPVRSAGITPGPAIGTPEQPAAGE
jgi:cytochrome d ubiquinol oxidase subunit I